MTSWLLQPHNHNSIMFVVKLTTSIHSFIHRLYLIFSNYTTFYLNEICYVYFLTVPYTFLFIDFTIYHYIYYCNYLMTASPLGKAPRGLGPWTAKVLSTKHIVYLKEFINVWLHTLLCLKFCCTWTWEQGYILKITNSNYNISRRNWGL